MPLVTVTTTLGLFIGEGEWFSFAHDLQKIIAEELHAPEDMGGTLTANEIEVRRRAISEGDFNSSQLMIEVLANEYPSRKANIQKRTERIAMRVREHPLNILSKTGGEPSPERGFVWVLLAPAGFAPL